MAEKRVIEISLKTQLREAQADVQKLSEKFGATSEAAVQAAKKAAELKDAIEDAKNLTDAFNPDAKFNALSNSIGGVLNGFQAFEGALGLVGVEAEAVQETMLRVQSALALSQGLQGLLEAKDSFKQLGAVAMNALKGIKTGLAATGIGLFVVALGTVVAYWDDIKEAVSGVSEEQSKLNAKTEANLKASEEKVSALDKQDNILKLQGKSEKEILQYKVLELDAAIKIAETNLENQKATKKAQVEAAKRNKDILVGILDFLTTPINLLLKTVDKVASVVGVDSNLAKWFDSVKDSAANLIFDPKETAKEGDEAIKAAEEKLTELKNQQAGYQLQIKEINKQAVSNNKANSDKILEAQKDEQDKKLQAEKEYNDKLRAYYDAIEQERQGQINDDKEKELQALDNKFEALYKAADDANQSDKDLLLKHQQEIADINLKYDLLAQEEAKKNADELSKIEKDKLDKIAEAEKLAAEKAQQAQQARVDLILKYAQTFGQAMSSLNNLLNANDEARLKNVKKGSAEETAIKRKMFERDKKLRIVQTVIDTASNVVQSVRNGGGIPIGIPFGVAAGAMGALQIAAISKAKFDGGGEQVQSPSGAGGGGGGAMAPNFNVIGSSGVNQLAQIQQQPTRAYVVSGDVANGLSLERNRLQNASF